MLLKEIENQILKSLEVNAKFHFLAEHTQNIFKHGSWGEDPTITAAPASQPAP